MFKHLTAFDRGKIAALRAAGNALQMPMKLAAIKARLAVNWNVERSPKWNQIWHSIRPTSQKPRKSAMKKNGKTVAPNWNWMRSLLLSNMPKPEFADPRRERRRDRNLLHPSVFLFRKGDKRTAQRSDPSVHTEGKGHHFRFRWHYHLCRTMG